MELISKNNVKTKKICTVAAALAAAVFLSACGGGGGGRNIPVSMPIPAPVVIVSEDAQELPGLNLEESGGLTILPDDEEEILAGFGRESDSEDPAVVIIADPEIPGEEPGVATVVTFAATAEIAPVTPPQDIPVIVAKDPEEVAAGFGRVSE